MTLEVQINSDLIDLMPSASLAAQMTQAMSLFYYFLVLIPLDYRVDQLN